MSSPQSTSSLFANPAALPAPHDPSSSIPKVPTVIGIEMQPGESHKTIAAGQPLLSASPSEKFEESLGLSVIEMQSLTKHESESSISHNKLKELGC